MEKIRVNEYVLTDPKLSKSETVVAMSDIHDNTTALRVISMFIKQYKVLCALIPGDTLEYASSLKKDELIKELKNLSEYIKVYVSTGNHDLADIITNNLGRKIFVTSNNDSFFRELDQNSECVVLKDDFQSCDVDKDISVSAINLPFEWYDIKKREDPEKLSKFLSKIDLSNIDNDKFNILLSHSINAIIQKNKIDTSSDFINSMNLILGGHNHGGLVPTFAQDILKGHRGIIGPYARPLQPNAYGTWTNNDTSVLVSNGVTALSGSDPIRDLLNKVYFPEIELIHINPGDEHSLILKQRTVHKL